MRKAANLIGYCVLGATLLLAYALLGVNHTSQALSPPSTVLNGRDVPPNAITARRRGWTPIWTGNLTGSRPDYTQWTWLVGSRGNPQNLAIYTARPANSSLHNHVLQITAVRDRDGHWTSGHLTSIPSFAPPPGGSLKISADVRFPNAGHGYMSALWLLGNNWQKVGWPKTGEFDIAETNGRSMLGGLHCGTTPVGGPCDEPHGAAHYLPTHSSATWRHFEFVWDTNPQRITWSVNGHLELVLTPATIGAATWNTTFNHPYQLIADVQVGGSWPGPPDRTTQSGGTLSIRNLVVATNKAGGAQ